MNMNLNVLIAFLLLVLASVVAVFGCPRVVAVVFNIIAVVAVVIALMSLSL